MNLTSTQVYKCAASKHLIKSALHRTTCCIFTLCAERQNTAYEQKPILNAANNKTGKLCRLVGLLSS